VERGYIGLRLQELTPVIAQALGLPETKGVLAASVEPNNPADRAGIKAGDVITSFNGRPVESGRELSRMVATLAPGTQVPVTVLRGNKPQDLKVVVGARSEDQPTQAVAPQEPDGGARLGLALSPIPQTEKDQLGLEPGTSGVLIDRVDPDSPAAANGLQPGDVIVSANNQPIGSPSDVANAWSEAQRQKKPMLLRVKRRDQYLFIGIMV
jgi:serine protease Do